MDRRSVTARDVEVEDLAFRKGQQKEGIIEVRRIDFLKHALSACYQEVPDRHCETSFTIFLSADR